VTTFAETERAALVDALRSVPPDAPTLCAGWTARDLAAHLVVRERRPDASPGIVVPALRGRMERVRSGYARRPYPELIELIASGPPWTSPFAWPGVDAALNFTEHLIHTEDVRRGGRGWTPRELPAAEQQAVWTVLQRRARLFFRAAAVTVVLVDPDGARTQVGSGPEVTLTGAPAELLLYAAGRRDAALVEVDGAPAAVATMSAARLGM